MYRWYWDPQQEALVKMAWPKIKQWQLYFLRKKLYEGPWGQGMARHSKEEVLHIAREDTKAISAFLGITYTCITGSLTYVYIFFHFVYYQNDHQH